jgi:hypothetical protein
MGNVRGHITVRRAAKPGADGKSVELIFRPMPSSTPPSTPISEQADGHVPTGWYASPQGVSVNNPYEFTSKRTKYLGVWGEWSTPVIFTIKPNDGAPAKLITLHADCQGISQAKTGERTPATILITATAQNTTVADYQYSVNGGVWSNDPPTGVAYSEDEITITTANVTFITLAVKAFDALGNYDVITIVRTIDGTDAYNIFLTNPAHTLPSDASGNVSAQELANATTRVVVYRGSTLLTYNTDYYLSLSAPTGMNQDDDNGTIIIEGFPAALNSSYVDITVHLAGSGTVIETVRWVLAKSKQGAQGDPGTPGTPGTDGVDAYYLDADRQAIPIQCSSSGAVKSGVLPIIVTFKLYKGHDRVNMLQNPYSITIEVTATGGVITGGTTIGSEDFDAEGNLFLELISVDSRVSKGELKVQMKQGSPAVVIAERVVTFAKVLDGTAGSNGLPGIPGAICRISEWVEGVEYRNDEALSSGTRFLDIAVVSAGSSFTAYKCKVTHTSSSSIGVSHTTYWEVFNIMAPIYTPLIMAQNAVLKFMQGNQLLIMKADGSTVAAGVIGGDYTFFSGDPDPADAPFSVTKEGYVKMVEGHIGILRLYNSTIASKYFKITDEEIPEKADVVAPLTATINAIQAGTMLSLTKESPTAVFESNEVEIECRTLLPTVYWGHKYTEMHFSQRPRIYMANENSSCSLMLKIEVLNNGVVVAQNQRSWLYDYNGGSENPYSQLSDNYWYLEKGTVKIRVTAQITSILNFDENSSFKFWHLLSGSLYGSITNIAIQHYRKRTEIGGNGFFSFWETLKFFYYSAQEGLIFKGSTDMPGVLAAASVASTGAQSNKWGAKVATSSQMVSKSTGVYTIPHNIGHSAYTVQVTCNNSNRYFAWCSSKGTSSVQISIVNSSGTAVDANFDYMIIGEN